MIAARAEHLLSVGATLGEGPVWIDEMLWFVDIKRKTVFRFDPGSRDLASWTAPEYVGWLLPSAHQGPIAGLKSGPHRFLPDTGAFERIAGVQAELPENRLNDAAIDGLGRIWFGTMDNREETETGLVFVLDRGAVADTGIAPVTITNGPAISPCGSIIYHVDTLGRKVIRHTIEPDGSPSAGEIFLQFSEKEGYPDGATCDAEGAVWIAFFGGAAARRFATDGTKTHETSFPVSNVTKIALGGLDGHTAYATTARQGLSGAQLTAEPQAGDLFTFRVDVPAPPARRANT